MNIKTLVLTFVFLGLLGFFLTSNFTAKNMSANYFDAVAYSTKSDSEAEIDVSVTPLIISSQEQSVFGISMNNHSVDLDYDFANIIKIQDEDGNQISALKWDGKVGGHHLDGKIIFPPLNKNMENITLIIDGVGDVERRFEWELNKK